jgi:hypothetical protein
MSRFSGPQSKGAQRSARDRRREEAIERDKNCPDERRRAFRLGITTKPKKKKGGKRDVNGRVQDGDE